jgi:DNA-directed RNA polymerase specialized sigma24 family protein
MFRTTWKTAGRWTTASSAARIDGPLCEDLARRTLAGDGRAWKDLVAHLWPHCVRIVASSRELRRFGASPDHVANVVTNIVGKVGGGGARGLKHYRAWRERSRGKTFSDWIRIVAANAVRDYVRDHADDAAASAGSEPGVGGMLDPSTASAALEEVGELPPITATLTARQLVVYAERHLPEDQRRALGLWIAGYAFDEIAGELALAGAEASRRQVRAAVAALRRQFAWENEDQGPSTARGAFERAPKAVAVPP